MQIRIFFVVAAFFLISNSALAYEPALLNPATPFEIQPVKDIASETWYAGELNDFPHTFEFLLTKPEMLKVQVMVPAKNTEEPPVSLIAVKEVTRGVEEVMRRSADSEEWVSFKDEKSKVTFLQSSVFETELEAGVYRIEVSNPVNDGRYVMKLGYLEEDEGYFEIVGDIRKLRSYLGLSMVGMLFNPYIFMPLFIILSLGFFGWYFRQKSAG